MKICSLIIILTFTLVTSSYSQANYAFRADEEISYEAYYHFGFIWLNAGSIRFNVEEDLFDDKPALKLKATGQTHDSYDFIFQVRDTFTSYVSQEDLKPYWFRRQTSEGGYTADLIYKYDYENQTIHGTKIKKSGIPKDSIHTKPGECWDMISIIYHLRELDFSQLKKGDRIFFDMIVDNEIEKDIYMLYEGQKKIKNKDGKKFDCLWFKPLLLSGTVFDDGQGMNIYLTNDRNHVPILIDSKLRIGSIRVYLSDYKNLKYPLSSEIL